MEWILNHILDSLGLLGLMGTVIYGVYRSSAFIGTVNIRLDNLKDRMERLEGYHDGLIDTKMKKRKSPVSLTPYAIEVLKDIEFDQIFDLIKKELCKRLDNYGLRTKYDVQEMANFLMRRIKEDKICDPLKQAAFNKGYNLDEILSAASIPLRDYYLEQHPEIRD